MGIQHTTEYVKFVMQRQRISGMTEADRTRCIRMWEHRQGRTALNAMNIQMVLRMEGEAVPVAKSVTDMILDMEE